MKADVCEILAHETCSESTKEQRRERVCLLVGQGWEQVFASVLILESSYFLSTFPPGSLELGGVANLVHSRAARRLREENQTSHQEHNHQVGPRRRGQALPGSRSSGCAVVGLGVKYFGVEMTFFQGLLNAHFLEVTHTRKACRMAWRRRKAWSTVTAGARSRPCVRVKLIKKNDPSAAGLLG